MDDNPNMIVFQKLEKIMEKMQDEKTGVQIRTVKTFMTKIPSVFTGTDLINWLIANLDVSDGHEALALANRMSSFGYFFPIDDHVLTVKNDNTYYRFQVMIFKVTNTLKLVVRKNTRCLAALITTNIFVVELVECSF